MKNLICIPVLFLCLFLQGQQYSFIRYSIEEGLAQSQVKAIFEDDKGFLWLGTLGGVSKFDGTKFTNYSQKNGLLSNQINVITQDKNGLIWFGSEGGLTSFNGSKFNQHKFNDSFEDARVTAMQFNRNGELLLGTNGAGLIVFNGKTFEQYNEKRGFINNYINNIYKDKNKQIWIATRSGICLLDNMECSEATMGPLELRNVSSIHQDRFGNYWVGTLRNGVTVIWADGSHDSFGANAGLISDHIRDIYEDSEGNMWIASKVGLSKFNGNSFTNFTNDNGLESDNIRVITEDSEGNIWLGTDGGGILKFTGEAFVSYTQKDGLPSNAVMSIIEDKDSNYWFSTYDGGVAKLKGNTYTIYNNQNGLPSNTVWTSLVAKSGKVWFGTSSGAACYENGKFTSYSKENGVASKRVTAIFEDKEENIWLGTKAGISKFDGKTFTNYLNMGERVAKNVRKIISNGDNIWFASASGLIYYNGNDFIFYGKKDGLPDDNLYTLVEDYTKNLWIGTATGISIYDGNTFTNLNIEDNFRANSINLLNIDDENNLWIGTNNGIYKLNLKAYYESDTATFIQYTKQEGITSLETNLNATYKDYNNNLWFGTINGVVKHTPSKTTNLKQSPPKVYITDIHLFLNQTNWYNYSDSINPKTGLPPEIIVPSNKNYFTFYYTGISLSNPSKLKYQFKLLGFDETWSPLTVAQFATYSNLPHGNYVFIVRATNGNSKFSLIASHPITINAPFYLRWWFYLLVMSVSIGFGYYVIKRRGKNRKRRQENEQLIHKSKLQFLEQQTLNASMNRHFVFNALNSIQYYINREDKLSANKYLTSFAKLIRKNLDSSQETTTSLEQEIERLKLYLTLEHMRFQDKFEYEINIDPAINLSRVKIPPMMLQPFVENSIWHGILPMDKKGKICIDIELCSDKDRLILTIEDNGIGIETSMKNKSSKEQAHISKGMEITSGRIELLQKTLDKNFTIKGPSQFENKKTNEKGTRVIITLPMLKHTS